MDESLSALAAQVGAALLASQRRLATAESCTGGWVAQEITAIPGSSVWFERGFVTYSNEAKQDMLGVKLRTLEEHGAVSEAVAKEMALGAWQHSRADVALSITGIAGPGGGSAQKPVGTVCFAWAGRDLKTQVHKALFSGDRQQVRAQAVHYALAQLLRIIKPSAHWEHDKGNHSAISVP